MISVIIPTFNREQLLPRAINSVLEQSFLPSEIIIVDDGSTDSTASIVRKYQKISPIPIVYTYQQNKGPSAARNKGIHLAKGEFIAFLDSDDAWEKNKLKVQIKFLENFPDIKVCYTNEKWIKDGKFINQKKKHQKYGGWIFEKCLWMCIISPSSIIIHKEVFDKVGIFEEELLVAEDYEMWLRISAMFEIGFIDKPLITKYAGNYPQQSKKYESIEYWRIKALQILLKKEILNKEQKELVVEMLVKKSKIYLAGCYKRGKKEEIKYYEELIKKYS